MNFLKTGEREDFRKMIWLSDLSKAAALKDKIKGKEHISFGLPQTIAAKELDLKSNLLYFEQAVYKESFTKNIRSISLQDENVKGLIKAKADMESFSNELRINFPNYYALEYGQGVYNQISPSLIDDKFIKGKMVIDFFDNKDYYLVSYISKNNYGVYKVVKTKKLEAAIDLLQLIIRTKAEGDYQRTAFIIYQELLEPILSKKNNEELIIIPDGKLAYIPFELLVNQVVDKGNFKTYQYLIKNYTISYQYAYSLIHEKQNPNANHNSKMLAMLPDFNTIQSNLITYQDESNRNASKSLSNLPFASFELNNLSTLYVGDYLTGREASESQFKAKAPHADIIHLATHSFINENNPMTSHLFLSSDEKEDGLLYTYELFNLNLKADLVTISACNSGYGEHQQGEGIISLARGFMYSGSPNILMSLWSVPDQSTSQLMDFFYKHINDNHSYEQSIRKAKLEYLSKADNNTAHPYYWGAFVYVGDTQKASINSWFYALAVFLIVIIFLVLYRYRILLKSS